MNSRHASGRDRCRGGAFTLVETLVATLLIAIVFVSLYAGVSSALVQVQLAREDLRATQVLLEKSELMRLYGWEQIAGPDSADEPDEPDADFPADDNLFEIDVPDRVPDRFTEPYDPVGVSKGNFNYNGTLTIAGAPISQPYTNSLKLVTVEVTWQSFSVTRRRELQTFVSRYGVAPRAK